MRRTTGWLPATSDINTLVFRNLDTLRARSRHMVRRNPWAANALDAFIGDVIGTGIKPQSLHPDARIKERTQKLRRVAYWLYREHPFDALHFRPIRPGQLRGQPWLTQVLLKLYELDQYDDAELVRKKTAAMFAGFVLKNAPEDQMLGETATHSTGAALAGLEPGTLQVLLPGEDIKFSTPADVGASYETFMRVQLRSIAAGMGITYEQLTGDLTGVNYSSIRAGLLEFRRRCEQFQHQVIVHQFCRPVWQRWIEAALLSGTLPKQGDLAPYYDAKWIPPGFAWVDPLKDIKAQVMAVRAGFKSRAEVVSEQGYDAEAIDREMAAENARARELGLSYDTDAGGDSEEA